MKSSSSAKKKGKRSQDDIEEVKVMKNDGCSMMYHPEECENMMRGLTWTGKKPKRPQHETMDTGSSSQK